MKLFYMLLKCLDFFNNAKLKNRDLENTNSKIDMVVPTQIFLSQISLKYLQKIIIFKV